MTKRRVSVGFAKTILEEPEEDTEKGPVEEMPALAPVNAKSAGVIAPISEAWEEDLLFVYGPSVIEEIAPLASFDVRRSAKVTESANSTPGRLISFDDRRMSVSGLASPGSVGIPSSRMGTSQPSTPNPSNISQMLFGSPVGIQAEKIAPAVETGRRESLMELTNVGSAPQIRGPAVEVDSSNISLENSVDQESNTAQGADGTGSFGAILKSRGVKRQRRDSVGSLLRRGVNDWETLEEGFESRPTAELSARFEADAAAADSSYQAMEADDLVDAIRPSKRRLSTMDISGLTGASSRSRRTSDVMDLTAAGTSRINFSASDDIIPDPVVVNAGGNSSLSDDDVSNMTLNLTKTFTGIAATRRFSLGADGGAMEQTAAIGGIIGLAGENTTVSAKRNSRLSLPLEFSDIGDSDPFPAGTNMVDIDDGMEVTSAGTSKIQMADLNTRRQSLGMDFTTAVNASILVAETTGRTALNSFSAFGRPNVEPTAPTEEHMQLAAGPAILSSDAEPVSNNWALPEDSTNESSIGTETIEARVNMEANKILSASPNSSVTNMASPPAANRASAIVDRRKSVGMEMTEAYGSITASEASPAQMQVTSPSRRQSMAMEMTLARGNIVQASVVDEPVQQEVQDLVDDSMDVDGALASSTATSDLLGQTDAVNSSDNGMLLTMSLRDELAAMKQENDTAVIVIPPTETIFRDVAEKSRRESVGALLFESTSKRFPDPDVMDVDEPVSRDVETTQVNPQITQEYELATPNVTVTMRARALAEFPVETPVGSSFHSLRHSLHGGEPLTLERFIFMTNLRFFNHRRSSIAPSMQTAVEPRSENAKIHTFFVTSRLAESQENVSARLVDEVRAARERIQSLEQRVRAAAAQNNVPVFRSLQSANEREAAKITQDLTKFKSALKHEARKEIQDAFIGKQLEETKQEALRSVATHIHTDSGHLETLNSQQSTDIELLRLEKDTALFRRANSGNQKSRRIVEKEAPKAANNEADSEDNIAIVSSALGWRALAANAATVSLQFKDFVRAEVSLPTRTQAPSVRLFSVPQSGFKKEMLDHLLSRADLSSTFDGINSAESLREAMQTLSTRIGRCCDFVKETSQLSSLFVARVAPTPVGIRIQATFSSSAALNRFGIEINVAGPPSYPLASGCVSLTSFENDFGGVTEDMVKGLLTEQISQALPTPLFRIFRALDTLCRSVVSE